MTKHQFLFILVLMLLITKIAQSQEVNIPDLNFKNALLTTICADTTNDGQPDSTADFNNDGKIQITEAQSIFVLEIGSQNISNLTGIESFINLTSLFCNDNLLTSIDLSQNTQLITLGCWRNSIGNLDLSQNTNLEILYCYDNQLTNLNVTQNTQLKILGCWTNTLSSLDVSQNQNLENLSCFANQLSTIDILQNINLIELTCSNNQLNSLNITHNINLERLICSNNQLTSLDVSQNYALSDFICFNNQLTNLDISQNNLMERFECYENQLISLNMQNGNNSTIYQFNATDNPNLTCIQVDNANDSNSYVCDIVGWCKDDIAQYSNNCALSIEEYNSIKINLYPNPVDNILHIYHSASINTVKIYSIMGDLLKEYTASNDIDVSRLTKGMYFIQVDFNNVIITSKFIKN